MKVAVFGLGYVGTVTAAVLASNGHEICGVDVDLHKTELVASGQTPVVEPGLEELVGSAVAAGHLSATTDPAVALEGAELSLICVGTPSSPTGNTDLTYVLRATNDIIDWLVAQGPSGPSRHVIVVRSTVPTGTIRELLGPLVAERTANCSLVIGLGMCPEFLREGSAIADFYDSPLSVVGTEDSGVAETMTRLLAFLETPLQVVATHEAEALKYACNAFHAIKVSFANELGRLFRIFGIDTRRVMELFCQDTKLNISPSYLAPGFAFGGSCLPKDLRSLLYLARIHSVDLPLLAGTLSTNELSVGDLVNRVLATDAHSVALLGLSFKMDSDDLRESPYVDLAEILIGKGFDVRIYDPIVDAARLVGANRRYVNSRLPHLRRVLFSSAAVALYLADLAVVSSSHPSIVNALVDSPPKSIIDLNGHLGPAVEAMSEYQGVAW